jgi:hypothetical protein
MGFLKNYTEVGTVCFLRIPNRRRTMVGERTEGDSPDTSSQTGQVKSPAEAETGSEVADALARVQEAVINVKEGGLPEALEGAIEAIDSAVREMPDKPEADQLNAVAEALEGALEEVEKGKVANLLPVLEEAQSIVESGGSPES